MKRDHTWRCGECNLIEEGLTKEEAITLAAHHMNGEHGIELDDVRRVNMWGVR